MSPSLRKGVGGPSSQMSEQYYVSVAKAHNRRVPLKPMPPYHLIQLTSPHPRIYPSLYLWSLTWSICCHTFSPREENRRWNGAENELLTKRREGDDQKYC